MISSFIAQNFAISDDYWVWNESNIIENHKKPSEKTHFLEKKCITILVTIVVTIVVTTMVTTMDTWWLPWWLPWSSFVTIVVTKTRKRTNKFSCVKYEWRLTLVMHAHVQCACCIIFRFLILDLHYPLHALHLLILVDYICMNNIMSNSTIM